MSEQIVFLKIGLLVLGFLIFLLIILKILLSKGKSQLSKEELAIIEKEKEDSKINYGKFHGVLRMDEIKQFLGFEDIKDGMIIRNNGQTLIKVIACRGTNFDLQSETEKNSIEAGFQQFLNVIQDPIQLYIQTRTLNFSEVLKGYHNRLEIFKSEKAKIEEAIKRAKQVGNKEKYDKLNFELVRKENIINYVQNLIVDAQKINKNENLLQKKSYIVISLDISSVVQNQSATPYEKYTKAMMELQTRAENMIQVLLGARVIARTLDSEELVELLLNAFNRDSDEILSITDYINKSGYEALYTTSKDVYLKELENIQNQISEKALEITASSITEAHNEYMKKANELKAKKLDEIRKAAKKKLEQFKSQINSETYDDANKLIDKKIEKIQEKESKSNKK